MIQLDGQLTLGLAAVRIGGGVQHHHLHRLCQRGLIAHTRVGRLHLVRVADLDEIRAACQRAGYFRDEVLAHA